MNSEHLTFEAGGAQDPAVLAAQLAAIVESSDDAIVSEDLDGVVLSWNAGAERIFGYSAKEMMGQPFAIVIPPGREQEDAELLAKIARGDRVTHYETVRLRKGGTAIHVSVALSPIRDRNGKVIGASKVARDITQRRQAEQRMAWLASFPERNPNPIVEVDGDTGEVLYMNPFAREAFADLPVLRFAHPLLAGMAAVAKELRTHAIEVVRREIAVGDRWFSQTIMHIAEEGRVRVYSDDVTPRRDAERKLRLSEFSVEQAAIAIYLIDSEGRILRANRATCEMLGYDKEELCALTIPDIAPEMPRERWPAHWQQLRERRKMTFETVNRRKDGSVFPVQVEVNLIKFEGEEFNFACVHDITERRRVDALLTGQRDLLSKIANGHPLASTLEDIMHFAEAQRLGMVATFLFVDEKVGVLRHGAAPSMPADYNRIVDGLRIGPAAGSCGTAAYRREPVVVRDIASDPLWEKYREIAAQFGLAACWSTPIFGAEGDLNGTFAMYFREPREPMEDDHKLIGIIAQTAAVAIDRARAEGKIRKLNANLERRVAARTKELEDSNRELESFSYSVSHDLRAPLRHVLGYVEMLERASEGKLPEKALRYLSTISGAAEHMSELIDDLLSFSRMGRAEMKAGTVALDGLVRQVIKGFELETGGRKIEWKIDPLPEVAADAAMLRLVFSNLIGNSLKYSSTRESARIEIGCSEQKDGRATIFVRDNGVGFDMQYAHKLFGVFQRLHRQEEFEGTGIGLATVRRIMARHGGTVTAQGEVDRGATFSLVIGLASSVADVEK